jgi:hypothetical protein
MQNELQLSKLRAAGSRRRSRERLAPTAADPAPNKNTPGLNDREYWKEMQRETGFAGQGSRMGL